MHYLYHGVPTNMEGEMLYPLNELKDKFPMAYEKAVEKYIGREHVMNQPIPGTDWLWNDVLHLAPILPGKIKEVLEGIGYSNRQAWYDYQIDPELLEPEKAIVFLYKRFSGKFELHPDDFVPYDPKNIAQYDVIPEETVAYFKSMFEIGRRPLIYHLIPHVLYKGTINVKNLPIVSA